MADLAAIRVAPLGLRSDDESGLDVVDMITGAIEGRTAASLRRRLSLEQTALNGFAAAVCEKRTASC